MGWPAKELHPRVGEFSVRDWETGWIFPEVRAYFWRHTSTEAVKHAIVKDPNGEMEMLAKAAFGMTVTGYAQAVCGELGPWYGSEINPGRYLQMPRCMECLRLIGAPTDHPYRWKVPPPRKRKKHAPTEVARGKTPFNNTAFDPRKG